MKKLVLLILPLFLLSCNTESAEKKVETELTFNAKKYINSKMEKLLGTDFTIDSLKLIEIDTITPYMEMQFVERIYGMKNDSLLKDSERALAEGKKYSILKEVVNESVEKIKENGEIGEKYRKKRLELIDKMATADSTTFLGYSTIFNVKLTRISTKEGVHHDSIPINFYKDLSIINDDNYLRQLLRKY